jgi:hypothetical protein
VFEFRRLKVLLLGSFRDCEGGRKEALGTLERLCHGLCSNGFDAFISGDERRLQVAGPGLQPRQMTELLEPRADLSIYVATLRGRADGWVSEITAMQLSAPRRSERRALLVEEGYPLSSILDPAQGGDLADPPILVLSWRGEAQMLANAIRLGRHVARFGRLPKDFF